MIHADSRQTPYRTRFSDGVHQAYADARAEKGGRGAGFGPHELLEASLACCFNIWLRMYAAKHGIPLSGVDCRVTLKRDTPGQARFEYHVELDGPISPAQRQELLDQLLTCPVCRTLSGKISFRPIQEV